MTQGKDYPADKVSAVLNEPETETIPDISESEAKLSLEKSVDVSNVMRLGVGRLIPLTQGDL